MTVTVCVCCMTGCIVPSDHCSDTDQLGLRVAACDRWCRSSGPSQGLRCHRGWLMSVDSGPRLQAEGDTETLSQGQVLQTLMCCMLQGGMQCHESS